jgi:hypothetical protein
MLYSRQDSKPQSSPWEGGALSTRPNELLRASTHRRAPFGIISRHSIKRSSIAGGQQTRAARAMSSPGVEPGLSRPRRDVLAARPRGNRRRRSSTSTSTSTSIGGPPTGNAFISSPARAPSLWSSALPAHHFQAAICKWRRDRHMHTAQLWGCCALWANTKTQRASSRIPRAPLLFLEF